MGGAGEPLGSGEPPATECWEGVESPALAEWEGEGALESTEFPGVMWATIVDGMVADAGDGEGEEVVRDWEEEVPEAPTWADGEWGEAWTSRGMPVPVGDGSWLEATSERIARLLGAGGGERSVVVELGLARVEIAMAIGASPEGMPFFTTDVDRFTFVNTFEETILHRRTNCDTYYHN